MAFSSETTHNPMTTTKKTSIGPNAGKVADWDAEIHVDQCELFCKFHPGFALWAKTENFGTLFWLFV